MADFTDQDRAHMARAIELAARGLYGAHPNPMVGCVIVRDEEVVGEGFHERFGEAHAEVNALREAGDDATGATVFVTLEPCAFHGKTPACAELLAAAGVGRVVAAMEDPHERVSGAGFKILRAAGIDVEVGLLQSQAEALNRGFLKLQRTGIPFVRLKIAASLDGCVAMANGQSQWITGPEARDDVQRLRARADAILTGIGTVLADDPSLTVRAAELADDARQPVRAVVDSKLRMPKSARMLDLPGETQVFCVDASNREGLEAAGATVVETAALAGQVNLELVLQTLGANGAIEVLVEAGPGIAGALVDANLVDELVIYQAPHIMGSETAPMLHTPNWQALSDRRELDIVERTPVGRDLRITARIDS
ncbi:MAG: bifunctional diaminohydroxyphosphoribosylaminopyrimidine deaminase/5-amino-6-(5-phosphoribosylamino)uracil reductase RibD [Woeseiaceae bacterium]|nr:bifunctional diaminohydroxyphosphoribosylaminopyrimidine deaminase/5-amino-6-(5-phosphoribosylamino)uracil reductase RibD [Woeseiaceae bacterium]